MTFSQGAHGLQEVQAQPCWVLLAELPSDPMRQGSLRANVENHEDLQWLPSGKLT